MSSFLYPVSVYHVYNYVVSWLKTFLAILLKQSVDEPHMSL